LTADRGHRGRATGAGHPAREVANMLCLSQAIGRPVLDHSLVIAASANTGELATPTRLRLFGSEFGGGAECST
jgi:hypothetical protein